MKEESLAGEIHFTAWCIDSFVSNYLGQVSSKLTAMEWMSLRIIKGYAEGELYSSDLMKITELSKSTTSQTLNQLLKKGFITMESSDREDRRKKKIQITETGIENLALVDKAFNDINATVEKGLDEKQKAEMKSILKMIQKNVKQ